jgi:hypothetical protein
VHPDEFENGDFQQDGATAHTSWENLGFLRGVVSMATWLAKSPDLTLLDFFGLLKTDVFKESINNLQELMTDHIEMQRDNTGYIAIIWNVV